MRDVAAAALEVNLVCKLVESHRALYGMHS